MDKKLFYEAPEMEVVEVKAEGFLCGSNPDNPLDESTADTPEEY